MEEQNKEKLALTRGVIFIMIISLSIMGGSTIMYFSHGHESYDINITFNCDSTITTSDMCTLQQSIEDYINDSEQRIDNRYKYFIEQKENNQNLFVMFSSFIGIIAAIFGFLGYKSLRDIENTSINNANNKVNEVVPQKVEEKVNVAVPNAVSRKMDEVYNLQIQNTAIEQTAEYIRAHFLRQDLAELKSEILDEIDRNYRRIEADTSRPAEDVPIESTPAEEGHPTNEINEPDF